ncbi:hypothetical protein Tco_1066719 [Tanacetum coccineum]|uniref:Reverse transcriptase RNase H-like domain-containing protein n=1 Tax=Tanacetum coccineum TaxID=301880 RepID=A0ABQ5HCJ8_9ASTR
MCAKGKKSIGNSLDTSIAPTEFRNHQFLILAITTASNSRRRWIELFSDYDSEIRYHPRKANVLVNALSRKEWMKLGRVRALSMIIHSSIKARILEAQSEASNDVNTPTGMLQGLEK